MVRLTNMSGARPNADGILTFEHVTIDRVRIYAGGSHVFPEMPRGALMYVYHPETNPHAPLDAEDIADIVGDALPDEPETETLPAPVEEVDTGDTEEVEGVEDQIENEEPDDGMDEGDTENEGTEGAEGAEGTGTDEGEQKPDPDPQGSISIPERAKSTDSGVTVSVAIEHIRHIETVEALDAYIEGDTRKTVIKVADERRRALEGE